MVSWQQAFGSGALGVIVALIPLLANAQSAAPSTETSAKAPESAAAMPVLMTLETTRDVYRSREAMFIQATFYAVRPVTLCLYPEHPEAQFVAEIHRSGWGALRSYPTVIQLDAATTRRMQTLSLSPGQVHRVGFNLKKLAPLPPSDWKTGDYRVQVRFFLCGKTDPAEQIIPSQGPLHMLVLE